MMFATGTVALLHCRFLNFSHSDVDLGRERPMDGTFGRDLHQFCVLFWSQWPSQLHFDIDSIEHAFLGFAFLAVCCIDARVRERNGNVFQRQTDFAARRIRLSLKCTLQAP